MDHQGLPSVANDALSSELGSSVVQKHRLSPVIDLRPVDAGIRPISDEIVQESLHEMPGVGRPSLHPVNGSITVVGGELRLTHHDHIHQVTEDHPAVPTEPPDPMTMDGEMNTMDRSQEVQAMTHQANLIAHRSGVLCEDKSLKLGSFPNQGSGREGSDQSDLQLGGMSGGGGELLQDSHHHHYYHTLHQAPIMVYEVPSGNIVPFDSIVPVPLAKGIEEKTNEGVDLLQASVNEAVYTQSSQDMSHSLYVLHQPQKKEASSEGMVIEQISAGDGVNSNIVLENRDENSFSKVDDHSSGMMPIGTEFSLISTSCYDNSVTTVANMAQLSMSAVYQTSTETDSEVALTLASLGNPKIEKLDRDCGQNQSGNHSNVLRPGSIISAVTGQTFEDIEHAGNSLEIEHVGNSLEIEHAGNSLEIEHAGNSLEESIPVPLEKKGHKPTLVLRSRRNKGNSSSQNQNISLDGTKKVTRRKKKREPKDAFPKAEEAGETFIIPDIPVRTITSPSVTMQNESQKENLLGQLLKASEHCEPATLIPEGVVDDVIPAVGYRIMDMSNLSEMIRMMHRCTGTIGTIVIQEQASLREGAVSQLSVICTGCQEGAVCATSNCAGGNGGGNGGGGPWDINARVSQLTQEFNVTEDQVQRMLEILGIFYRPSDPALQPVPHPLNIETPPAPPEKKKRKKKSDTDSSGKPKNLVCTVCKERFVGANHLKKHMHSHDLSLHTCPYCHAYFKKPFNLKQHIKKHKNCKYECTQCQRVFTDKSTLLCHIRSQHEKRYNIQCDFCLKRFYHRAHYNEHVRIHTGEKPYMCELCGKKFSWHDSVKKHMQTHSAESKYKCRLCGKWFRWLQGVRQHLQQQHKLKKCDIEAQVVTAATETSTTTALPPQQHHHQQQQQQHHNTHNQFHHHQQQHLQAPHQPQQTPHQPHQTQQSTPHPQQLHSHAQPQILPPGSTQQQQQQQQTSEESGVVGGGGGPTGSEYHTLEAATTAPPNTNNNNNAPPPTAADSQGHPSQPTALDIFHVEVEGQQAQNMFQYH